MKILLATLSSLMLLLTPSLGCAGGHEGKPPSFETLDTNGDGMISKDEAKGKLADHFDKLDKDGDGYLKPEDMPKPPKMEMEMDY
ncbi:hypothetical protein VHP8226_03265 [Vibrio hippocampi]|uniref:EF-hand domain-containing protein n=2 Tax=Vibrio hippocampi TaxID=654686 RepID=A0ABM8ZLV7_9VIBR|nr:hypothetical protein VHP8226_03265 [Vibrio hippocampi]